jgi:hypothetical protein
MTVITSISTPVAYGLLFGGLACWVAIAASCAIRWMLRAPDPITMDQVRARIRQLAAEYSVPIHVLNLACVSVASEARNAGFPAAVRFQLQRIIEVQYPDDTEQQKAIKVSVWAPVIAHLLEVHGNPFLHQRLSTYQQHGAVELAWREDDLTRRGRVAPLWHFAWPRLPWQAAQLPPR